MNIPKAIETSITAPETRASLKALQSKLNDALPYSYGYSGAPAYIEEEITSINFRLVRLITSVNHLEIRCPAKFYKTKRRIK